MSNDPAEQDFFAASEAAVADTQLRRKLENATGRHLEHVAATRAEFPAYEAERDASSADRPRSPVQERNASGDPTRADGRVEPSNVGGLPEALRRCDDQHRLECGDGRRAPEERRGQGSEHRIARHDGFEHHDRVIDGARAEQRARAQIFLLRAQIRRAVPNECLALFETQRHLQRCGNGLRNFFL